MPRAPALFAVLDIEICLRLSLTPAQSTSCNDLNKGERKEKIANSSIPRENRISLCMLHHRQHTCGSRIDYMEKVNQIMAAHASTSCRVRVQAEANEKNGTVGFGASETDRHSISNVPRSRSSCLSRQTVRQMELPSQSPSNNAIGFSTYSDVH